MLEEKGSSYVGLAGELLASLVPTSCKPHYDKNSNGA